MDADFTIKQNATRPVYTQILTRIDGTIVDLTTATSVKFVMRAETGATAAVNAAAAINAPATNGSVSYTFLATDTAIAGTYQVEFVVTYTGGAVEVLPGDGYYSVVIQPDLSTAGGTGLIVNLGDIKAYLNIVAADHTHDSELLGFAQAATIAVEQIVGPVAQRTVNEWNDGGAATIVVRQPPIVSLTSITEYRGNVAYPLAIVASPDLATSMSVMFEPSGRITRLNGAAAAAVLYLSTQGLFATFPVGPNSVQITYVAGRASVAANIRLGVLETVRENWQPTQQGGRPSYNGAAQDGPTLVIPNVILSKRILSILGDDKRGPSVA